MQQIVNKLGISEDMHQALMKREGRLGQALQLVEIEEKATMPSNPRWRN